MQPDPEMVSDLLHDRATELKRYIGPKWKNNGSRAVHSTSGG